MTSPPYADVASEYHIKKAASIFNRQGVCSVWTGCWLYVGMLYQINQLEVLFPSLKLGNNTFDLSRFAVAAVNSGNRKTWHILLPTFQFGSNKYEKLGFGLMRLPQLDPANAASVDVEQVKQVVERFLEKGFAYFDTAWMYAGFASENVAKEALVDRHPRDSFTLAAKLHAGLPDGFICISVFLYFFLSLTLGTL